MDTTAPSVKKTTAKQRTQIKQIIQVKQKYPRWDDKSTQIKPNQTVQCKSITQRKQRDVNNKY